MVPSCDEERNLGTNVVVRDRERESYESSKARREAEAEEQVTR